MILINILVVISIIETLILIFTITFLKMLSKKGIMLTKNDNYY